MDYVKYVIYVFIQVIWKYNDEINGGITNQNTLSRRSTFE